MPGELVVLENQLKPLAPHFAQVLGQTMPVERLIRTVVVSCERLPKLLECDRQSVFNAAMSAACLGLEVDGVTGQAFLIPFKNKAQLVIGYKGFNTLAARSGYVIRGGVVREGDEIFDFDEATAHIRHKPTLGNKGRIIAAWALAVSNTLPSVLKVLSIDEIMAIKNKSPGAKRDDSPWNDPNIGFPAMAEKSAKRRLARSMPLNVMQLAARMDEAFEEQGIASRIAPDKGLVIDGEFSPLPAREDSPTPSALDLISPSPKSAPEPQSSAQAAAPSSPSPLPPDKGGGAADYIPDWENYVAMWDGMLEAATDGKILGDTWNSEHHRRIRPKINWPVVGGVKADLDALLGRVKTKIAALGKTKEPA